MTVPAVAVVGPTAAGKSAVAIDVAERMGDVELVSVDSMQVYRGMDIGTAKPTPDERSRVRHHLIDLVEATADFTVAEFQRSFRETMADLAARRRRALLVGGTGLYHRAAIDDLDLPGEWPTIRSGLLADADGPEALHRRLATVDPAAAAKIDPANTRRIVRALEVCQGSGRRFSSFGPGLDVYPAGAIPQVGLHWERAVLADRIEQRVHAMMTDGLLDEVQRLAATGGLSRTAAQALGYRELLAHLAGQHSLEAAVEQIVVRTRQFAIRQIRWFRRDPRVVWVEPQAAVGTVVELLTGPHSTGSSLEATS